MNTFNDSADSMIYAMHGNIIIYDQVDINDCIVGYQYHWLTNPECRCMFCKKEKESTCNGSCEVCNCKN